MVRISVVLLVDPEGRVLLQERDENAPRAANQWGIPGGHVEDGEEFEAAVYRELAEETGLVATAGSLELWQEKQFQYSDAEEPFDYNVWIGATSATDADIVVGEGRRIVFVDSDAVDALDKSESCAHFVPAFIGSDAHRRMQQLAATEDSPRRVNP